MVWATLFSNWFFLCVQDSGSTTIRQRPWSPIIFCCLTEQAVLYLLGHICWATSCVHCHLQKVSSMPRYTPSQLRWSEQAQTYVLSIGDQASEQALSSAWLEQIASFSFHSRRGMHYTVRKQRVQRGSSYWYAYRRLHARIVKRYLGRTADLTLARLEEIARLLESTSGSRQRSLEPDQQTALPQSSPPAPNA